MINIFGSRHDRPPATATKYRLRIEGIPDNLGKGELIYLLESRYKSARSLDIQRSQSHDSSVKRIALFSVTDEKEKDQLLSEGVQIEGRFLNVTQEEFRELRMADDDRQSRVFVTNIPYGTSDANLMKFFNKFGPCEQDEIGRISPTGKELTFCTLTFQDISTAKMLVAKKTIEFNGRKLKLIEYDRSAEGKLDQHKEGTLDYLLKGQNIKSKRKGSFKVRKKSPQQLLMCEKCLSTKFITKCICSDAPMFQMQAGTSKQGGSTQESPSNRLGLTVKSSLLDSPGNDQCLEPRMATLNIMNQLKQTGLLEKTASLNKGLTPPIQPLTKSAPNQGQQYCKPQQSSSSKKSKSKSKQLSRFISEQTEDNHFQNNLRYNQGKHRLVPNLYRPP